jgi:hypothetical protein
VGKEGKWDFCGTSICVGPNGDSILLKKEKEKEKE